MNRKDEKGEKDKESFSDSAELFDTIFTRIKDSGTEASDSGKRPPGKPDPSGETVSEKDRAGSGVKDYSDSEELFEEIMRESRPPEGRPPGKKKQEGGRKPSHGKTATPGRPEPPGRPPVKVEKAGDKGEAPAGGNKPLSSRKPAGKLNPLTLALAAVLLIVLTGAGTLYLGIIDIGTLTGSSEEAGMSGVQKKVQERALVRKSAKRPEEKKEPAVPREGEVPKMPAKRLEPVPPAPPPSAAGAGAGEAPAQGAVLFSEGSDPHPYSVYLGSFRSLKQVEKAMSGYQRMGLSPYWFKMDLGDKGIWFRIFANHFKTREEADAFIKARKIPDASSRYTKYAVLTGVYTSEEELNTGRSVLLGLGYSPYRIQGEKGVARLYVGAFYRRVQAEKQQADLASRGIECRAVER